MAIPRLDIDLFADDVLADPFPHYKKLRAAGAAVYIEPHGFYAFPRYEQAYAALADHKTFSSAHGVGLLAESNGFLAGTIIASDPPEHDALRKVLAERLAPRAIRNLSPEVEHEAENLVASLVARGSFDAVSDFAEVFPLSIIGNMIGLPPQDREKLLEWGYSAFDIIGPSNARSMAGLSVMGEMAQYIFAPEMRDRLAPGSLGAAIFEAADRGLIAPEQCAPLLMAYTTPSIDTTAQSLGMAILLFGRHPEQWQLIKNDPTLIPAAYSEILRYETPLHFFTRTVQRKYSVEDEELPLGARVAVLFASANRDERRWVDADQFEIRRNPTEQLAFGHGIHSCTGQGMARLEAHAVLAALARQVDRFDIGEPSYRLNNNLRSLRSLPVTVR